MLMTVLIGILSLREIYGNKLALQAFFVDNRSDKLF